MHDHYHPQNLLCSHLGIQEVIFPFWGNVEAYYLPRSVHYPVFLLS